MRDFWIATRFPQYTPEQALQMHMDEEFQQRAALECNTQRTLTEAGHAVGNAFERRAHFQSFADVDESAVQRAFKNFTDVSYIETSRYYQPPQGTVDIDVLTPAVAQNCVMVHTDLFFEPSSDESGTTRSLHTTIEVNLPFWVPFPNSTAERMIAEQLCERLSMGADFATRWAAAYPNAYLPETGAPFLASDKPPETPAKCLPVTPQGTENNPETLSGPAAAASAA